MDRVRELWKSPAGRGFLMLATMSAAYGFAYSAQTNIVTNYFEDILHFNGPEFGYITAVREVGGFLLIFLTAVLYRVSLQRLTAGALVFLAVGYGLFGVSHSFLTVVPWVIITSFGFHTVLQTQYSLGMSLTTQAKSGQVLGRMAAFYQGGTFAALVIIFFIFHFHLLSYELTFIMLGFVAFVGGIAIFRFPHLHEGHVRKVAPKRARIVWRNDYRLYYLLNLFDGVRQQIFFSFGLWVLVNRFELRVAQISLILLAVTFGGMVSSSYVGRLIDRHGEGHVLQAINAAYVVALTGFALANNVVLACLFYVVYAFIFPFSPIAASTYLRKIAVPEEVAPSLAMGVTIFHATAIVVPVVAGFILNFVGYQIPFFIACGAALLAVVVTLRLNPGAQRTPARVALDEARPAAEAGASMTVGETTTAS
jgi:predicted MFS family arabinose efflux permease